MLWITTRGPVWVAGQGLSSACQWRAATHCTLFSWDGEGSRTRGELALRVPNLERSEISFLFLKMNDFQSSVCSGLFSVLSSGLLSFPRSLFHPLLHTHTKTGQEGLGVALAFLRSLAKGAFACPSLLLQP